MTTKREAATSTTISKTGSRTFRSLTAAVAGAALTLSTTVAGASVATATTVDDHTAPSVPGNVVLAETSDGKVSVSWTASTDDGSGVRSYLVYVDGAYATWSRDNSVTVTAGPSSAIQVRATDFANNRSAKSSAVSLAGPDVTAPSVPKLFDAETLSDGRLKLSWEPSSDNVGVRSYLVYVNGAYYTWSHGTEVILDVPTGEQWNVQVRAVDRSGNRSAKSEVTVVGEEVAAVTTGITLTAFLNDEGQWRFNYASPGYNGELIPDEVETVIDSVGGTEQQFGKIQVVGYSPYTNSSFPFTLGTGGNPIDRQLFSANRPPEEFVVQYVSNDGSIVHFEETIRTTYLDEDPLNVTVTETGVNEYTVDLESYTGLVVTRTNFRTGETTTGVIAVYWFDANGERQTVELLGPGVWTQTFTTTEPIPDVVVVEYRNLLPVVATAVEVG